MKPTSEQPSAARGSTRKLFVEWAIGLGVLLGFGGLIYVAWQRVGPQVTVGDDYRVTAEQVEVTPPPPWIRTDIKAAALRDAGFDESVSLLEKDLVERIARAFALQPWVSEVVEVRKSFPAQVQVKLDYRRPVCMVEVPGGLYAVDVEGVVLPSHDFSPLEAREYPRLGGVDTAPLGPVGTSWGDARVLGGARIAASLLEHWSSLGLSRIVPRAGGATSDLETIDFEIESRGGTRILWGHAPQDDFAGESSPEEKVQQLIDYVAQHGPLDGPTAPTRLDLTQLTRAASNPADQEAPSVR